MADPRLCREFLKGTCYRSNCGYVHSYEGDGRAPHREGSRYGFDRGAPRPNPSRHDLFPHNNEAGHGQGPKGQQPTPGDWLCGPCDTLNFKKRDTCCRCDAARAIRSLDLTSGNIRWFLERRERQEERRKRRASRPRRYAEAAERRERREREREARREARRARGAREGDGADGTTEGASKRRRTEGDGGSSRRKEHSGSYASSSSSSYSGSYTSSSSSSYSSSSSSTGSETRRRRRERKERRDRERRREASGGGGGV